MAKESKKVDKKNTVKTHTINSDNVTVEVKSKDGKHIVKIKGKNGQTIVIKANSKGLKIQED